MSLDEFKEFNKSHNENYYVAVESPHFKAQLPTPDQIYYKDFHFLDEPLINRKHIPKS